MPAAAAPVVLYVAVSLDGFIADADGGIGWLSQAEGGGDYGYGAFLATVGALVMGRATYDQVRTFGPWPYAEQPTYVLTHRPPDADAPPGVTFTDAEPAALLERIRAAHRGAIWLVGGGQTVAAFRAADAIDAYEVAVIPTLLGAGLPLFPGALPPQRLRLTGSEAFPTGVVMLRYARP